MKKRFTILAIVVLALIGGGTAYIARDSLWPPVSDTTAGKTVVPEEKTTNPTEITYAAKEGISSLEQLTQETNDVVTVESTYGKYVDSIGEHKGGTDGNYWSFYIDGKLADVGADSYIQKGGEKIEWKFQKL